MKDAYLKLIGVCSLCFLLGCENSTDQKVFQLLNASETGIDFINQINETDSLNMYSFMNIYTGGGVGIGDVNNDGLPDIFFSGNMVSNRLFLNKGNLKFEDITVSANITENRWCTGVAMADVNQDGWLDIYVSVSGTGNTANLLYINNGDLTFTESADKYGVAEKGQAMHASFFDFDKDGDLDLFTILNPVDYSLSNVNNIKERDLNGESNSTDKLYRNNGNDTFTEISHSAGILSEGYSLGVATSDLNGDNWPDIYISNDFLTNDVLYINNQDGTFSNQSDQLLDHTSFAGMGSDVSDFNNDGYPDILVADMLPEDNLRRKTIIPAASYDKFQLAKERGYDLQYTRNTLQLNNGNGTFSEIGQLAGVDQTDWSWSTLFADYDNDGDKDLFIANGFYRNVGDLDYITYQKQSYSPFGKESDVIAKRIEGIKTLPSAKLKDYLFKNNGNLTFEKESEEWGIEKESCSNGASFADLDNDGDLELVVNVINDQAFIYKNTTVETSQNNYIKISLEGEKGNRSGFGTKIELYTGEEKQYYEQSPFRGYGSTVGSVIHFGLGTNQKIDSLKIIWASQKEEWLRNIPVNQVLKLSESNTNSIVNKIEEEEEILMEEVTSEKMIDFVHKENNYVDFKAQPLLPHKHSMNGPGIAVGDINGDQLDDFYVGGARGSTGKLFKQKADGTFIEIPFPHQVDYEDMGSLLIDVDNDNDLDLYIVSGGSSYIAGSPNYQDRLYLNDGTGNFTLTTQSLPEMPSSGASVSAIDYDKDGDLDIFIGSRVLPGKYPLSPISYLLRNDSQQETVKFTNVTKEVIPQIRSIGMITSSIWSDYDNDGWVDLLVVGEWMPLTVFKNNQGKFTIAGAGTENSHGWWNSLVGGDFDNDGDIDYVAGNLGLNTRYKTSIEAPICIYAKDFDNNGSVDPVMCYNSEEKNYIIHPRDRLIEQLNGMRIRFKTYEEYGNATFDQSFLAQELEDAQVFKSEVFESSYFENLGNGKLKRIPLPIESQIAPINGIVTTDLNADGKLDLLVVGNSYATEVAIGRYDACKGLLMMGNGDGTFEVKRNGSAGFLAADDTKSIVKLAGRNNELQFLVSSNSSSLKSFRKIEKSISISIPKHTVYAWITGQNGEKRKQEFYFGEGYLSQSARQLFLNQNMKEVTWVSETGEEKNIMLNEYLQ